MALSEKRWYIFQNKGYILTYYEPVPTGESRVSGGLLWICEAGHIHHTQEYSPSPSIESLKKILFQVNPREVQGFVADLEAVLPLPAPWHTADDGSSTCITATYRGDKIKFLVPGFCLDPPWMLQVFR